MNAQEVWNRLRIAAAHAALGGNAKIFNHPLRGRNSSLCSFDSIGGVYKAEVEFRFKMEVQGAQRGEIGFVIAVAGHGHVHPVDLARQTIGNTIGYFNQFESILRLFAVAPTHSTLADRLAQLNSDSASA